MQLYGDVVEMSGFEPLACYMRSNRSSQLSYTPTAIFNYHNHFISVVQAIL